MRHCGVRALAAFAVLAGLCGARTDGASAADGDPDAVLEVVQDRLRAGDLPGANAAYENAGSERWTKERRAACDALARAWTDLHRRAARLERGKR